MQAALKANAAQEKKTKRQRHKRNKTSTEQREAEQAMDTERRKRARHEMTEEERKTEGEKDRQRKKPARDTAEGSQDTGSKTCGQAPGQAPEASEHCQAAVT